MQYREKIEKLKLSNILLPALDIRARETSFREFPVIRRAYSEILGIHHIDHFSINMVLNNGKMLVFSVCPEIAYTLYSSQRGIEQDLAISPTFYDNLDFYFWEDCYSEETKREVMNRKEERFGIKAGAVIVKKVDDIKYLLSFGTKSSEDSFKQDIISQQSLYEQLGSACLETMGCALTKYIDMPDTKLPQAKVYMYASKQLPVKHNFANESKLLEHFEKHGGEFKGAYKTPEEYLQGANFVIEHGHKVKYQYMGKERTGYVRFMGNSRNLSVDEAIKNFSKREMGLSKQHEFGEAKFEFLALRDDGAIATYHTQGAENFYHTLNQNSKNSTVNVEHLSCRMM